MDIKRLVNDERVTDHTALLPTKKKCLVDFSKYSDNEKKVLEMLYQNLEEATSNPYRYEKTCVTLTCAGELFTATGVRNLELGWKKNRPDEAKEYPLPVFHKGDRISVDSIFIKEHQTDSPEHFTDGKLLKAMEEAGQSFSEYDDTYTGIGTPATRAEIIEKLVSGGFIERVGEENHPQNIAPTELASFLYQVLPDRLKSAELTAEWEVKLSEVEKGILNPDVFLEQIRVFIQTTLSDADKRTFLGCADGTRGQVYSQDDQGEERGASPDTGICDPDGRYQ